MTRDVDMGREGPITYRKAVQRAIRVEQREMRIEQAKIQAKPPPKEFQPNRQDWQPSGNKKHSNQSFQAGQGQNERFMSGQQNGQSNERQWPEWENVEGNILENVELELWVVTNVVKMVTLSKTTHF